MTQPPPRNGPTAPAGASAPRPARRPAPGPAAAAPADGHARLDARSGDVECMVGFSSGRYTAVSAPLWLGVAVACSVIVAVLLALVGADSSVMQVMNRSWTNWAVLLLTFWCMGMLYAKWVKTSIQMRALRAVDIVPRRGDFVLSPGTAGDVLHRRQRYRACGRLAGQHRSGLCVVAAGEAELAAHQHGGDDGGSEEGGETGDETGGVGSRVHGVSPVGLLRVEAVKRL